MDPQRRAEIGAYICASVERLVAQWEKRSRAETPEASQEQRDDLRNHLPQLLCDYGESLKTGNDAGVWANGVDHGLQRNKLGWSAESLVRDFTLLRRLLVADLRTALDLTIDETIEISVPLDEAVAASVAAYSRQRQQESARLIERLKDSNEELKRFAQVLAHEIRNPLAVIVAAVHIAERQTGEKSGLREPLGAVSRAVGTIRSITDDLLRYAQVEGATETPSAVDLARVAKEAVDSLGGLIAESGATVEIAEGGMGGLPTVQGFEAGLKQLFVNLIENAIKYRREEAPKIRIYARPHHDDGQGEREKGEIQAWADAGAQPADAAKRWEAGVVVVEDNGLGIPDGKEEEIFRFFRRAHADKGIGGAGIGLAMCKRVAQQHGGSIWVESKANEGSRFIVRLPGAAADAPSHAAAAPPKATVRARGSRAAGARR